MSQINQFEITRILDVLIGNTTPIGSTSVDDGRTERLKVLIDVTRWCIDGIGFSAELLNKPEYSIKKNAELAYKALSEIKEFIDEVQSEVLNEFD